MPGGMASRVDLLRMLMMNKTLIDSSSLRTNLMGKPDKPVIVSTVLAALMGLLLGGYVIDYKDFFVTSEGLERTLVVPALILGLIAGWWCWMAVLVLLSTSSLLLLARSLVGREFDLDYFQFAFSLTVVSIWEYAFLTLLAAYIAAFFSKAFRRLWKVRNQPGKPAERCTDLPA